MKNKTEQPEEEEEEESIKELRWLSNAVIDSMKLPSSPKKK